MEESGGVLGEKSQGRDVPEESRTRSHRATDETREHGKCQAWPFWFQLLLANPTTGQSVPDLLALKKDVLDPGIWGMALTSSYSSHSWNGLGVERLALQVWNTPRKTMEMIMGRTWRRSRRRKSGSNNQIRGEEEEEEQEEEKNWGRGAKSSSSSSSPIFIRIKRDIKQG